MSEKALKLIEINLDRQDPYLDLGNCGLTYADCMSGSEFNNQLRKCVHLEVLILSNRWFNYNETTSGWIHADSRNNGERNVLKRIPDAIEFLQDLKELHCGGFANENWSIEEITIIKNLKKLEHLDLAFNRIISIKAISQLVNLQVLDLCDNNIKSLSSIENLEELRVIDFSVNKIQKTVSFEKSKGLFYINLATNRIKVFDGFEKNKELKFLDFANNLISEIRGLEKLVNLQHLNLDSNKIFKIAGLDNLKSLQSLTLSSNLISKIENLNRLTKLELLDLCYNQISRIENLDSLRELKHLILNSNDLEKIEGLENLDNLLTLELERNFIETTKGIENKPKLKKLKVNNNNLKELHFDKSLVSLECLVLMENEISDLAPLVPFLQSRSVLAKINIDEFLIGEPEKGIFVSNNPLTYPPSSVIVNGVDAVLRYFEKIASEGKEQVFEAKMILAGAGESGKTSLSLRLSDENCPLPEKDDRTKEIIVSDYIFLNSENKIFTAHIWDFGGQQVIHNFHRLFMNESALYILLTETSRENDDFDYWFQTIKLFGGDSPILFVQNQKNGIPRRLSLEQYKPYFNIKEDLFDTNILTNEGLQDIREAIQFHIQQLPIVKKTIPKSWFLVREALSKEKQSCINYDQFKDICKDCNLITRTDIEDVGDFLHNLGIILWYRKNPALKERIILDKQWATKALFQLIFNEKINKTQKGYFTLKDAQIIWDVEKDYCHHTSQLLELMLEFKLAYKQKNKPNAYILPALLQTDLPKREFRHENRIVVEYHYTHLPRGIVNHLTAEMSDKIQEDGDAWNEGVWLSENNTEAKITENRFEKVIKIEISGEQYRELFGSIKSAIDSIHKDYRGIKFELKIPCICSSCRNSNEKHFFNYQDIIDRIEASKKQTIECVKSTDDVLLQGLLDYLLPQKPKFKEDYLLEKLESNFSKLHKANQRTHEDLSTIKNEINIQNESIVGLLVLSNQGKDTLNTILNKIDASLSNEKAFKALEDITNEMTNLESTLPLTIATEWKKLSSKPADDVEIKTKLKLKIPIIPFLMDYETEWGMDAKKLAKKLQGFIF
jgi:internalin A